MIRVETAERPFPEALAECLPAPPKRSVENVKDLMQVWADERLAGADCRDKLARLRAYYTENE